MPCFRPLLAHRSKDVGESGKAKMSFDINQAYQDLPSMLPCGRCIGCRQDHARQWYSRCIHESKLHQVNSFLTLTYNPDTIPEGFTLVKEDLQKFIKRLRKSIEPKQVRYYACGEYGKKYDRPHYHLLLFGYDFIDKRMRNQLSQQSGVYTSEELEKLWTKGFSTVGDFNEKTCKYVTSYVTQKITGKHADSHYQGRTPEFATMSRRPGIGHDYFQQYTTDFYPKDYFTIKGVKLRPPKYYDNLMEKKAPKILTEVKNKRIKQAKENDEGGVRRYYIANVREKVHKHFERQTI